MIEHIGIMLHDVLGDELRCREIRHASDCIELN